MGAAPLRMLASLIEPNIVNPDLVFKYSLIDIRDLNGGELLASPHIEDNVLAILTRWKDQAAIIRQILARIANLEATERRAALSLFLIISELRVLATTVKEEAGKMPILLDIMDHSVIGPAIKQGLEQGRQEARHDMLILLIKKKFGTASAHLESRLAKLSAAELDEVAVRVLEVSRVEDLFPKAH